MLYADDLAVIVRNKKELKSSINMVEKWCKANYMRLNYDKCGAMKLRARRGLDVSRLPRIKGIP